MRDKLIELIDDKVIISVYQNTSDVADLIIAALPGMIKPLPFYTETAGENWLADTPFGVYEIYQGAHGKYQGQFCAKRVELNADMTDAKAAAQADYTRRIMEAFGL